MLWKLSDLMRHCREVSAFIDGRYVPARPVSGPSIKRWRAAWAVIRGKADAFIWPGEQ